MLLDLEDESSRSVFRSITEATFLSEKPPVFVADIREVSDIQSHFQVAEIPSLLFFVKGQMVEVVNANGESDFVKALVSHDLAKEWNLMEHEFKMISKSIQQFLNIT